MFGAKDRIARSVYVSLTEEERQLEKLALTIPGLKPGIGWRKSASTV